MKAELLEYREEQYRNGCMKTCKVLLGICGRRLWVSFNVYPWNRDDPEKSAADVGQFLEDRFGPMEYPDFTESFTEDHITDIRIN